MKYFLKFFNRPETEVTYSEYAKAVKAERQITKVSDTTNIPASFSSRSIISGRTEETESRKDKLIQARNRLYETEPKGKTLKKSIVRVIDYLSDLIAEEDKT